MDWFGAIAARLGKWAAYSDYCLNSDYGLAHCRTFWHWAWALGGLLLAGLAAYVIWEFTKGRGESRDGEAVRGKGSD